MSAPRLVQSTSIGRLVDQVFAGVGDPVAPGAAVGVAVRGEVVCRKAFGLASAELPAPLTPAMRMRVGSVTKQFTALACLLLCEEGRCSIDTPVGDILPDLHPVARGVTVRQLLGHASGLRDVFAIKLDFAGTETMPVSAEGLMALYRDLDNVEAPPGQAFAYNNGGYLILTRVIETLSGQSLEEFLRARVFAPIRMSDTLVRHWDDDILGNSASPHARAADGRLRRSGYGMDNFAGGGAVCSTVDDLLRWLAHMDNPIVGSPDSWRLMTTPGVLPTGVSTHYGLGLSLMRYRGLDVVCHSGGGAGCNAFVMKAPAVGLDVVVLSNCADLDLHAAAYALKLTDACVENLDPLPEGTAASPISGLYRSPRTGRVAAFAGVHTTSVDAMDLPFVPVASGVLRAALPALEWEIRYDAATREPAAIDFFDFGAPDRLHRLSASGSEALPVGRCYRLRGASVDAVMTRTAHGYGLHTEMRWGARDYALTGLGGGVWDARASGVVASRAVLFFEPGVDRFTFSNFGNRGLVFDAQ